MQTHSLLGKLFTGVLVLVALSPLAHAIIIDGELVCGLQVNPSSGPPGTTVTATYGAHIRNQPPRQNTTLQVSLDFGDGSPIVWDSGVNQVGGSVPHTYDSSGQYTVTLDCSAPGGVDTKTKTVTITPSPSESHCEGDVCVSGPGSPSCATDDDCGSGSQPAWVDIYVNAPAGVDWRCNGPSGSYHCNNVTGQGSVGPDYTDPLCNSGTCAGRGSYSLVDLPENCVSNSVNVGPNGGDVNLVVSCTGGGQTHLECQNNQCVSVSGPGSNQCSNNNDCTPPGLQAPSQPTVSDLPACTVGDYTSAGTTIDWSGTPDPVFGWYVDIDDDPNFGSFFNKQVPSSTSQTNTLNFKGIWPRQAQTLALFPDIRYYVRVYNGLHSPSSTFLVPACRFTTCSGAGPGATCISVIGQGQNQCTANQECIDRPYCTSFTATPTTIILPPAQTSTLQWDCEQVSTCEIDQGIGNVQAPDGQKDVQVGTSTLFTLTCQGQGGQAQATTSINTQVRIFRFEGGVLKEVRP